MTKSTNKIERYLNPVNQLHLINIAPFKTLIAGRGFSKSFGNGLEVADKVERFPRSCGLFNSPTYSMIYTKTLLPMKAAWEQHMRYIEDIHYVVGKAPPKHFAKPWHAPRRYENVVTFWNGTTVVFGSFDRPALISGGSYDWVITDEAYLIEKEDYDRYVVPSLRPSHPSFRELPKHLQHSFTSSMPFRNQGMFLLDNYQKAKSNPKMYSFIGWEPNAKYQMGYTWMNRYVLGDKAILQMQAEMNENDYKIMILNQLVTNFGNLFYPSLSNKHFYVPKFNGKDVLPLGQAFKRDASFDDAPDDYNPSMPLHISHDWGVFNSITIDQEYPKEVRFVNVMHVLNPKTLDDLADEFAEYYRMHKNKIVYQWGDAAGNNKQANSRLSLFEQFAERLRSKGWRVRRMKTGHIEHLERHRFISRLHKGEDPRLPKVTHNRDRCADLKTALEATPMKDDQKDKSSERNPSIKPEHATHCTDAYDYRLYWGFYKREKVQSIDPHTTSLD